MKATASRNGRWAQGRIVTSQGYVLLRVGPSHPLADSRGYAYEHTVLWVAAFGRFPDGHCIHHLNGCKDDNRLSNLMLEAVSDHARHHARERCRDKAGRFRREA